MDANDYKAIDQYLQNELPVNELPAFQQRLIDDAAFAAELTLRQQMHHYLRAKVHQSGLEEKMAALSKLHFAETQAAKISSLPKRRWMIGVAAAAAILLLLVLWNPFKRADLYQQYAQHQPLSLTEKSSAEQSAATAEASYNAGDYENAYTQLAAYLQTKPDDNQARLALGVAALETERVVEAQSIFNQLAEGNSVFKSAGTWYLALSYLRMDAKTAASATLKNIPASDPDFGAKAAALREDLE